MNCRKEDFSLATKMKNNARGKYMVGRNKKVESKKDLFHLVASGQDSASVIETRIRNLMTEGRCDNSVMVLDFC